jgi:FkbM family methyltransferase
MKYSQNNEEEVIRNYFLLMPENRRVFLDIGANDGKTLSNTFALALAGWSGSLVEASPAAYERLVANYAPLLGVNKFYEFHKFALAAERGTIPMNQSGELLGVGDVSLVSTIRPEEMERFKAVVQYETVQVNALTFNDFLEISEFSAFDFISLDIEGCELEILPLMDLDKLGCKLFCIEWNGKQELKNAYDAHVAKFNAPELGEFKIIHTNGENIIYGR